MRTRRLFWVDRPPEAVHKSLTDAITQGELRGDAHGEGFRVFAELDTRNSWRPRLSGAMRPLQGGTLVEVEVAVAPVALAFTAIHSLFLFGIAWMMGIAAFSWEVESSLAALYGATGAPALDETLSDPLADGAEAGAPWSFRPESDLDGVQLTVMGPLRWTGRQPTAVLRVERAGVRIGDSEHPWHVVAQATLSEGRLKLGGHTIDCRGHSDEHLVWLVDYLRAKGARLGASEADRAAFAENARRLAAVHRDPARP